MFNEVKKSIKWGEETLTLETGKIARQADSTVIATYGETSVLAAVCFAKKRKRRPIFLSTYSKLSRKILCCRQNSWWFLQERSTTN